MDKHAAESPQLVVAGRFLTEQEEARWQRALRDPVYGLLCAVSVCLIWFFALQTTAAAIAQDWRLPSVVLPLIAVCTWVLFMQWFRIRRHRRQVRETERFDLLSDRKTLNAGCMISLYDDHAAYSTMRGSSVLAYGDVTRFCETADGILFGNDRMTICFRSADRTQTELSVLRRFLCERIRPSLFRVNALAQPEREEPLPTVRFANYDTVITHAQTVSLPEKGAFAQMAGLVIPQMVIYGLVPAFLVPLTPWPLLNCAIFCTVFSAVGALLAFLVVWLKNRHGCCPVQLAFTKEGIAEKQNGVLTFTVWERCAVTSSADGLTVRYASGKERYIPWSAAEDPDALQKHFPIKEIKQWTSK